MRCRSSSWSEASTVTPSLALIVDDLPSREPPRGAVWRIVRASLRIVIPAAPSLNLAPQLTPTSTRVILRREAKGRERREEAPMDFARRDLLALSGLAFAGAMRPSAGRAQT